MLGPVEYGTTEVLVLVHHWRSSTGYRVVSPVISSAAATVPTLNVRQLTSLAFLPLSPVSVDASLLKVS